MAERFAEMRRENKCNAQEDTQFAALDASRLEGSSFWRFEILSSLLLRYCYSSASKLFFFFFEFRSHFY